MQTHEKLNKSDISAEEVDALLSLFSFEKEQAWNIYLNVRSRLSRFFSDKGCLIADDCADDTLNRAARQLSKGAKITTVNSYSYILGIARNVLREYWKSKERKFDDLDSHSELEARESQNAIEQQNQKEGRLQCLDQCLSELPEDSRRLIVDYHGEEADAKRHEHRKNLAQQLGVNANTLRIRACRLRDSLEKCVKDCLRV